MTLFDLKMYHIDVGNIIRNASPPMLYEEALAYETEAAIADTGALMVRSGEKTGRSPKDKRIVKHNNSEQDIWWGGINIAVDEHTFEINRERAVDYLNTLEKLYVVDGFGGWDEKERIKVRIICTRPYHALFMHNMLIRPTEEQLKTFGEADVSIFFGLSGTGKTTLSADPRRKLIGDDEHCWTDNGIFNIEGGCYAKAIDLSAEKEPEIYKAIRYGTVLENVVYHRRTREVDYSDTSLTQNTRAAYPIEFIDNAKVPCVGGHPKNIILLTCDAFGVLPPVSKLTAEQAMYHFISGYTAKVAGTEMGVTEPAATFSACFGAAFMVWHPSKYAELLAQKMAQHGAKAWLINTGWTGGPYGIGSRIKLKYTRAIIDAIHSGALDEVDTVIDPIFGLAIPTTCPNVPPNLLLPKNTWPEPEAYDRQAEKLANLFTMNFAKYTSGSSQEVISAGPRISELA